MRPGGGTALGGLSFEAVADVRPGREVVSVLSAEAAEGAARALRVALPPGPIVGEHFHQ